METVRVKKQEPVAGGWKFFVSVGEGPHAQEHVVTLDRAYGERLTGYKIRGPSDAEELVEKSFLFLLERESKEKILKEFDMRMIAEYFPEYEYLMRGI